MMDGEAELFLASEVSRKGGAVVSRKAAPHSDGHFCGNEPYAAGTGPNGARALATCTRIAHSLGLAEAHAFASFIR